MSNSRPHPQSAQSTSLPIFETRSQPVPMTLKRVARWPMPSRAREWQPATHRYSQRIRNVLSDPGGSPNEGALLGIASLAFQAGVLDKAAEYYSKYLQLVPDDVKAKTDLALVYVQSDRAEMGIPLLEEIKRDAPTLFPAALSLALAYEKAQAMRPEQRQRRIEHDRLLQMTRRALLLIGSSRTHLSVGKGLRKPTRRRFHLPLQ